MHLTKDLVIIGLATPTSAARAATDIPAAWQRFAAAGLPPTDGYTYAVYCDYESDFSGRYTLVLGVAAAPTAPVPEGMRRVRMPIGEYRSIPVEGDPSQVIWQAWAKVNASDASRRYIADCERYTSRTSAELLVGV